MGVVNYLMIFLLVVICILLIYMLFIQSKDTNTDSNPSGENGTQIKTKDTNPQYDYIIVGSGAGGATVACRLALNGYSVLVLEAGPDYSAQSTKVPVYHTQASEDVNQAWNFYVKHYSDDGVGQRDPKYRAEQGGVLYPRASALGGCTNHHALITIMAPASDWDNLANFLGDSSYSSANILQNIYPMVTSYVNTEVANISLLFKDPLLLATVVGAIRTARINLGIDLEQAVLDPVQVAQTLSNQLGNLMDPTVLTNNIAEALYQMPLNTISGVRQGPRERLLQVSQQNSNLTIQTNCFVNRVIFDSNNNATGVEYMPGSYLYPASPLVNQGPPQFVQVYCNREVILAGGAFNTPQILMLSGIGDQNQLGQLGINVVSNLPGVGKNLQDRIEVGVQAQMKHDYILRKKIWDQNELADWSNGVSNLQASNGAIITFMKKSDPSLPAPDLHIFGFPAQFSGYYPNYSNDVLNGPNNVFTWAILKGYASNNTGSVSLRSSNPLDMPLINFAYENIPQSDFDAVNYGIQNAVQMFQNIPFYNQVVDNIIKPDTQNWDQYIKDNAWGHHACGTAKMGTSNDGSSVVDNRGRVFGVQNLRVIDASIWPFIPGTFIWLPTVVLAEKIATDIVNGT